jgi:hypothetical protein
MEANLIYIDDSFMKAYLAASKAIHDKEIADMKTKYDKEIVDMKAEVAASKPK